MAEGGGIVNMAMDPEAPPPSYEATVNHHRTPPPLGINHHLAPPPLDAEFSTPQLPPSYERIDDNSTNAPPSYESLYGQMRAAKEESNSVVDFLKKLFRILINTIGFTIGIGLLLAIPVSMIVIGAMYMNDCPRQPYIPIFLTVGGCFGVLKNLLNVAQRVKRQHEHGDSTDEGHSRTSVMDGTVTCFLVAWFIAGNVWVYGISGSYNSDPTSLDYCNSTLYLFSFWLITGLYILFGLLVFCICFTGCLFAGMSAANAASDS